jgi:Tol biopolymer transport system component
MSSHLLYLCAIGLNHLQRFFIKHKQAGQTVEQTTAWKLLSIALVLLCATATKTQAAFPLSDTLGPNSTAPVSWVGTATGPANISPVPTCREGLDCDTFVLTFTGTTADWAGKTALIKISWQLFATDYDLYILRELPSGQFVIAQSTNHPTNSQATQELIDFSPAFYGTGRYLVRVMYTAATFADQYQGSATVAVSESSCRVPGLTVLSDQTGDAVDAKANHDIERVSIAEPYLIGTSKLVFNIKAANLNQLTPNTSWRVYFRTPSAMGPRYFVDMRTDTNGAISYKYGTGPDTTLGDVDEGHYNAQTGTITITVAHNKVGFPRPNQSPAETLAQIYAQVIVGGVAADSAPNISDLSQASYTVVGNSMCNPGKIAFISNIDQNNEVYVMNADGSNPINMTNNPATEYSPSWSPDGRKITFASSRAGSDDIFVMDADGGNPTNLTNMPGSDLEPAWSPDGKLIAFDGWRDTDLNPGTAQIYLMNASGTNQVRLTHDTASYRGPTWSPDGKKLAFWGGSGPSEIFVMNADGTNMTQLTSDPRTGNVIRFENIHSAWSPDGTRIAFSSNRDENYGIYVMNADGSNIRKLTSDSGNDVSPTWSPDGLCIAFSSDRDGDYEIYAMNADGSNQTKLTSTGGTAEGSPAWQSNFPPTLPPPAPLAVLTKTSDFDADGKDDLAFWRSSNSSWNIINSSNSSLRTQVWGEVGDVPVPGDYDGDGKTDLGVFKPASGIWTILRSQTNSVTIMPAGQKGDVPAPGDYDGDGKTDIAFFRTPESNWYIIQSSNGVVRTEQWGTSFDRLAPGDYDGDGKTDLAVFRSNPGVWYILKSSGGSEVKSWGKRTDLLVPADYDGDGKTDVAIFRPEEGNWYIIQSSTGTTRYQRWADGGESVVPADYDGDGKTDLAVWRPLTGEWRILSSLNGTTRIQQWGQYGDVPIQHLGFATY